LSTGAVSCGCYGRFIRMKRTLEKEGVIPCQS
jgi:hypothetical protein